MFLRFMGGAMRSAPWAWRSAVTGSVSSVLAATVQGTVFGGRESAFEVVASSEVADWQEWVAAPTPSTRHRRVGCDSHLA